MSDLIDRQAAIEAMLAEVDDVARPNVELRWWNLGLTRASKILEQLPSAEPERKKGKWIKHDEIKNVYGGVYIECSECGEKYVVQYVEDEKFCRNCGAEMKGEEE